MLKPEDDFVLQGEMKQFLSYLDWAEHQLPRIERGLDKREYGFGAVRAEMEEAIEEARMTFYRLCVESGFSMVLPPDEREGILAAIGHLAPEGGMPAELDPIDPPIRFSDEEWNMKYGKGAKGVEWDGVGPIPSHLEMR